MSAIWRRLPVIQKIFRNCLPHKGHRHVFEAGPLRRSSRCFFFQIRMSLPRFWRWRFKGLFSRAESLIGFWMISYLSGSLKFQVLFRLFILDPFLLEFLVAECPFFLSQTSSNLDPLGTPTHAPYWLIFLIVLET